MYVGLGSGKWEMENGHWDWELRPFGTCRRTAYNLANWLMNDECNVIEVRLRLPFPWGAELG